VYLNRLGLGISSLDDIVILGESIESCVRNFIPHSSRSRQSEWRLDGEKSDCVERAVEILREVIPREGLE
jgi:hypothetical protein